jgi:AcrR family transcriptional regulator
MFQPLPITSLLKVPRQRRSVDMVHALLDATIVVLQRDGMLGFTTNAVAQTAGASIGSLYQYFANKDALIAGVVERGVLVSETQIRSLIVADGDPAVLVRLLLHGVIASLSPYRALLAELMHGAPLSSRGGILGILEPRLLDATRDYLLATSDRQRPIGGPAALYVMVNSAAFTLLKWLADQPPHVSQDALVDALSRQMLCHLAPLS